MDSLVDIFYYDFILSKLIEMYHSNVSPSSVIYYLKIATILSKKFRLEGVPLDRQVYLKEIYIKTMQLITQRCSDNEKGFKATCKLIDCYLGIGRYFPGYETDTDFIKLRNVIFALYIKARDKNNFDNTTKTFDYLAYISKSNDKLSAALKSEQEDLISRFSKSLLISYLQEIKFENPLMKKFVNEAKDRIDKDAMNSDIHGETLEW